MGLFDNQKKELMEQYEAQLTKAQVDDMERQGVDVTYYREVLAKKESAIKEVKKALVVDLSKLEQYKATPRDTNSAFFNETAGKPPLFGKDKWRASMTEAPLIFGGVVQANSALFKPGNAVDTGIVFVFSTDPAYQYNIEWIHEAATRIQELKASPDVPEDAQQFIKTLRNDRSSFCFPLTEGVTNVPNAWCATFTLNSQAELPHKAIPNDRILPFLLKEQPKENQFIQISLIPGKYYL